MPQLGTNIIMSTTTTTKQKGKCFMAIYKTNHKSMDYRFTVTDKNDSDLIALKRMVRQHNKRVGNPYYYVPRLRVSLRARGNRKVHAINDGLRARAYDQQLPHKYASHFDVYVSEVHTPYTSQQLENMCTRHTFRLMTYAKRINHK